MSSRYMLCFNAVLENLTALQPENGWNDPKEFNVKVECRGCHAHTNIEVLTPADLTVTCPTCNQVGTIRTIGGYGEPLMNTNTMKAPSADAMLFEAEKFEPIKCQFDGLWIAKSVNGEEKAHGPFDISGEGYFVYDEEKKKVAAASDLKLDFVTKYLAS